MSFEGKYEGGWFKGHNLKDKHFSPKAKIRNEIRN